MIDKNCDICDLTLRGGWGWVDAGGDVLKVVCLSCWHRCLSALSDEVGMKTTATVTGLGLELMRCGLSPVASDAEILQRQTERAAAIASMN